MPAKAAALDSRCCGAWQEYRARLYFIETQEAAALRNRPAERRAAGGIRKYNDVARGGEHT